MNYLTRMKLSLCFMVLSLLISSALGRSQKKGVGVAAKNFYCGDAFVLDQIEWYYNWGLIPSPEKFECDIPEPSAKFMQMTVGGMWGLPDEYTSEYVMGFNEPNLEKPDCLEPVEAAERFREMQNRAPETTLWVSPSATDCKLEQGKCCGDWVENDWFDAFFEACEPLGCKIDVMAVHKYVHKAEDLMRYLQSVYDRYGLPLWLTEFSCSGKGRTEEEMLDYMKATLPLLEEAPHVARYAWFDTRWAGTSWVENTTNLFEWDSSKLTPLGEFYFSFMED